MNILEMARKAGFRAGHILMTGSEPLPFIAPVSASDCRPELERFAQLVAEHEREECAKIAENYPKYGEATAEEIRTRGQS